MFNLSTIHYIASAAFLGLACWRVFVAIRPKTLGRREVPNYDLILKVKTDGVNYGLETDDIISQLKQWETVSNFKIVGAGHDYVYIRFSTLPRDLAKFTKEVFAFCPDIPGVGEVSEAEFIEELKAGREILFWWD